MDTELWCINVQVRINALLIRGSVRKVHILRNRFKIKSSETTGRRRTFAGSYVNSTRQREKSRFLSDDHNRPYRLRTRACGIPT